ncbi:MAG: hypothetical protein NTX11_00535 [Candidatus Saccharibacteria bacterium]|nr:hypothetical protein [Candidatus Saccharibacteria bacterium]
MMKINYKKDNVLKSITRTLKVSLASLLLLLPTFSILFSHTVYALAGNGSAGAPFLISNCTDLRAMDDIGGQENLHFKLTASFSCSSGGDLLPIGKDPNGWDDEEFNGEFDGNGFTISDVTVNGYDASGLFTALEGAYVHDLTLTNITVNGGSQVGGLAGYSTDNGGTHTILQNITVSGSVNGNYQQVGGIIGSASTTDITNVIANVAVAGGCNNIGGAFGALQTSNILNSSSTGNITAQPTECLNSNIGGFAGSNFGDSTNTVENSFATGNVTADSSIDLVGGFVGQSACVAQYNNSYATGTVTGRNEVGGFVGQDGCMGNGAKFNTVSASGEVTGVQDVGGLIGVAYISGIRQSKATGNVHGDSNVGGLVGSIVGNNSNNGYSTTESFATGNAYGDHNIGGFSGNVSEAYLNNNYSRGLISGGDNTGGFIGNLDANSSVFNSYSTGLVPQTGDFGGFLGTGDSGVPVFFSFWDTQSSGTQTSFGAAGKTTLQMKTESTYTTDLGVDAWNFDSIWGIKQAVNDGYPCLQWQLGCNDATTVNLTSPEDATPIQLSQSGCATQDTAVTKHESELSAQDAGYSYPSGLVDFKLTTCASGGTSIVSVVFTGSYDPNNVVIRKFNSRLGTYTTLTSENSHLSTSTTTLEGKPALLVTYWITDGGPLDSDGLVNGQIVDPVGIAKAFVSPVTTKITGVSVPNTGIERLQ